MTFDRNILWLVHFFSEQKIYKTSFSKVSAFHPVIPLKLQSFQNKKIPVLRTSAIFVTSWISRIFTDTALSLYYSRNPGKTEILQDIYSPKNVSNNSQSSTASCSVCISQKMRSSGSVPENRALTQPPFFK